MMLELLYAVGVEARLCCTDMRVCILVEGWCRHSLLISVTRTSSLLVFLTSVIACKGLFMLFAAILLLHVDLTEWSTVGICYVLFFVVLPTLLLSNNTLMCPKVPAVP